MSSELDSKAVLPGATVIDEAYMGQFTNDQLAYKAWIGTDLVQEILWSEEEGAEDCIQDAKFEASHACMALRVTGMDADILRQAVQQRQLEMLVLCPVVDRFPAGETVQ
ncbi:hypothetical protein [Pseudomonas sp. BLCC-B112]|uniref:hypothetical protein n=1 Tax=Pseudomonas sp. BLCC-B112 TaxID=3025319 RepID=UPI00234CCDB9|nr:hypothetical protein [Pseudomonas sp. BLCC-B112]MDC7818306.1 hypothetical protein [Pseudomonas sp. BLCC-B112]